VSLLSDGDLVAGLGPSNRCHSGFHREEPDVGAGDRASLIEAVVACVLEAGTIAVKEVFREVLGVQFVRLFATKPICFDVVRFR
jgi:hypothetical protein